MAEQMKQTLERVHSLVSAISYKPGWRVNVRHRKGRVYLQLSNEGGVCSVTGQPTPWVSGKRFLSAWMCNQEIVGVVFDLIKAAEMHEVHEWFRYKGAAIYNPHLDPDKLAEFASKKENFTLRQDSMEKA